VIPLKSFAQDFDDKPGSNVMSFSLTARMDLAGWLMTLEIRWTSGSAKGMGHFL